MTISIRNPEADVLARRLAEIEGGTITDAVVMALREALQERLRREKPSETARRILEKHGLKFKKDRQPVTPDAFHALDHDLTGDD
ncbi:type II toxin-antitoxin system VapB family antitoxin [Alsobacter sp. KACC 23698]|uniref:Type II toxin-antitoxin system VapB family antitoxin n=1 Tax=Alsobacter sp. KACC 23698 TaxID=3149229 RepID=A0AAU7JBI5_9HYPH